MKALVVFLICLATGLSMSSPSKPVKVHTHRMPMRKPGQPPNLDALNVSLTLWKPGDIDDSNPKPRSRQLLKIIDQNFKYNNTKTVMGKRYEPNWESLDKRPLPEWYDKAKIGIMLHWGLYSVPAFWSEWFWYLWKMGFPQVVNFMKNNYPPGLTYEEFAPMFTAERFDPDAWAQLFVDAGAKYVVLTAKHHDGFALFPTTGTYLWNSVDIGPHRDLVGDLAKSVKNAGLEFGVYYSLYEWFHPVILTDKSGFKNNRMWRDIKQLVYDYKPSIIWIDGDWAVNDTELNNSSINCLAWLYNDSPVKDHVVINDRWGNGTRCRHGDFYNCNLRLDPGYLVKHKWENALPMDRKSWCYRRNMVMNDLYSVEKLVALVVRTISCGGNVLINVGPRSDGTIAPIFQERLLALGRWLKVNGEAIYETSPWLHQNDTYNSKVWYTCKKTEYNARQPTAAPQDGDTVTAIYAIFLEWPWDNTLILKDMAKVLKRGVWEAFLLGRHQDLLGWKIVDGVVAMGLPNPDTVKSNYAWVIKFNCKLVTDSKYNNPPSEIPILDIKTKTRK